MAVAVHFKGYPRIAVTSDDDGRDRGHKRNDPRHKKNDDYGIRLYRSSAHRDHGRG